MLGNNVGKTWHHFIIQIFFLILGAWLAAFAIEVFLIPNRLIDGGIVGIAMILATLVGQKWLPWFLLAFNLPFIALAYRVIGKNFVISMLIAVVFFALFLWTIHGHFPHWSFVGESLEVVVIGGAILGMGIGLIIRYGGCLDGTEILGIIANDKTGFTVGQVVFLCNVFVFGGAGLAFRDWHPPLLSLITYLVVIKVMDAVIVGLDETKSVLIISAKSQAIGKAIVHELGLGLTVMYGRGGFSGDAREILYVIVERLQLADLKALIHREDPSAFVAVENLHEVANGKRGSQKVPIKERIQETISHVLHPF